MTEETPKQKRERLSEEGYVRKLEAQAKARRERFDRKMAAKTPASKTLAKAIDAIAETLPLVAKINKTNDTRHGILDGARQVLTTMLEEELKKPAPTP